MRMNYALLSLLFLLASVPLAVLLLQRRTAAGAIPVFRVATFNAALHREQPGQLLQELRGGQDAQARQIAEIVQRAAVDVLLLCELDRDEAAATARVFADEYLAVGQNGLAGIRFEFSFAGPVNTGEPTGLDLDGDGRSDGPADAHGYGRFPGQYGMALLSRHPILHDRIRTFRLLPWSAMPSANRPQGFWSDEIWSQLRLSSKSHWDVPIGVLGREVHLLCSHPTPPVFDGPEDRNGCRNHDEIRFWIDYLTPAVAGWIVDDQGRAGGLAKDAEFVLLGDLNCDPLDGDGQREAIHTLLRHPRVQDPEPRSTGGADVARQQWGANAQHRGDPALDTADFDDLPGRGPGNLRVDYVLPARSLQVVSAGVFWPPQHDPASRLVAASDHRLVWADLAVRGN